MPQQRKKRVSVTRNTTFLTMILVIGVFLFVQLHSRQMQNNETSYNGEFYVHIIDVGQGEAILIQSPNNEFMLIDTGESTARDELYAYLDKTGVDKFKYVIFTHPHSDHIGSAASIVNDYPIETLMMPYVSHTTKTFSSLMEKIEEKNVYLISPEVGEDYMFDDVGFIIVAPNSAEYENLNNYSIAVMMVYKNNTFMFTGDMEKESENEVIEYAADRGTDLSCDVLKIAHHGSKSSTQSAFLAMINPRYAIISCGRDNSYGHPNPETLDKLTSAAVYRTDLHGSIVVKSNGKDIEILTEY